MIFFLKSEVAVVCDLLKLKGKLAIVFIKSRAQVPCKS